MQQQYNNRFNSNITTDTTEYNNRYNIKLKMDTTVNSTKYTTAKNRSNSKKTDPTANWKRIQQQTENGYNSKLKTDTTAN